MTETAYRFPPPETVCKLLTGMLGRHVSVTKSLSWDVRSRTPKLFGIYKESVKGSTGVCVLDLPLAAYSGAALVLFPGPVAEDAIRSGVLEDSLLDGAHEVLSMSMRVFNESTGAHVTLCGVCHQLQELPKEAIAAIASPAARLDMEVSVTGYGRGRMTMIMGR
ncbi:MAG TPA: hypothetical protein VKU01_34760 [Bryobacteraceae bacterium]|nr:hypothetical protein [Bryobacteraceae bacterium]